MYLNGREVASATDRSLTSGFDRVALKASALYGEESVAHFESIRVLSVR